MDETELLRQEYAEETSRNAEELLLAYCYFHPGVRDLELIHWVDRQTSFETSLALIADCLNRLVESGQLQVTGGGCHLSRELAEEVAPHALDPERLRRLCGATCKHYKRKPYRFREIRTHTETGDRFAVYDPLYEGGDCPVRPLELFCFPHREGNVWEPRFHFASRE